MIQYNHNEPNAVYGGFSLLELVLVLAIIATLSAIAAPRYAASVTRYRADVAARRIAADLALARNRACGASQNVTVAFGLTANEVTIIGVPHLNDPCSDYVTSLSAEPYKARLVWADFGGDSQVVFDLHGVPDSSGQVVIEVGNVQQTIVLDPVTGKAAVQ